MVSEYLSDSAPHPTTRTCWLLSDGAPGHVSQSCGLTDAIARFMPLRVVVIDVQVRRRLLKSAGRVLLRFGRADWLLNAAYRIMLPYGKPDFIVSSGGNTLLANALLARRFGVPNFYSGTPKGFDPAWYARVFTVTPQGGTNNVVLPLPPVPGELCATLPAPAAHAPLLLLIGGDGGGMQYSADDWCRLATQVNALAAKTGRRWLITTSRRTGVAAEEILARELAPSAIEDAVWWSRMPHKKVMREFLARASAVYVTGDSMTMIAEAIYAARPVHVVMPAQSRQEAQDAHALAGYVRAGFVRVSPIAAMADNVPLFAGAAVPDVQALIRNAVQEFFP